MKNYLLNFLFLAVLFPFEKGLAKNDSAELEISALRLKEKYYKNVLEQNKTTIADKLEACENLLCLSIADKDHEQVCIWYLKKAEWQGEMGRYSASLYALEKAYKIIDSLNLDKKPEFKKRKQTCLFDMGRMAMNLGFYDQSVSYLYDLLSLTTDVNQSVQTYSLLSLLFINMNKVSLAEKYIGQARDLIFSNKSLIDTATWFFYYNHEAACHYTKKEYHQAVIQMEKAETFVEALKKPHLKLVFSHNLSNVYLSLGETSMARQCLLDVLEACEKEQEETYLHAVAAQNVAYTYYLDKMYDKALKYYKRALEMSIRIDAKTITGATLLEMSDLYKELGDYKRAWEYQKKGYILKDSVMSVKAMEEVMLQTDKFEQRNQVLEKQLLTQNLLLTKLKNRNKNILLAILFFVLLIFIILLLIILKRLWSQTRDNKNLHKTLSHMESQTKQEMDQSTKRLSEDIDYKNRKLASSSLMLIQSNEIFAEMKSSVKKLRSLSNNSSCKEIIKEMDEVLNTYNPEQSWQEFALYFEQVHPDFFRILNEKCSDLSMSEQRTCALIYLNLSTKEIAAITHRSTRTVETISYQIRKKLNIPQEEKTRTFLQNL